MPFVRVAPDTLEHELMDFVGSHPDQRHGVINTRIRLIIRRAYGFDSPRPLISLAMLSCGACRPTLPGRAA